MTTLVLSAAPFIATVTPKIRALCQRISNALDAFAEAQMRNTVSERQLRKAQHDAGRIGRMMHTRPFNHSGHKGHAKHQRSIASNARHYR
jgi:hypothetical protein